MRKYTLVGGDSDGKIVETNETMVFTIKPFEVTFHYDDLLPIKEKFEQDIEIYRLRRIEVDYISKPKRIFEVMALESLSPKQILNNLMLRKK